MKQVNPLQKWINDNGLHHGSFGKKIGRKRLQVFRYCHGQAVPRKDVMKRIKKVTLPPSVWQTKTAWSGSLGKRVINPAPSPYRHPHQSALDRLTHIQRHRAEPLVVHTP